MKIFISSSFADQEWADELASLLEAAGVKVIGPNSVSPGDRWEAFFRQSLESAEVVVAVLTNHSVRSQHLLFELGAAMGAKKQMILLLVAQEKELFELPPLLAGQFLLRVQSPQEAAERIKQHMTEQLAVA